MPNDKRFEELKPIFEEAYEHLGIKPPKDCSSLWEICSRRIHLFKSTTRIILSINKFLGRNWEVDNVVTFELDGNDLVLRILKSPR